MTLWIGNGAVLKIIPSMNYLFSKLPLTGTLKYAGMYLENKVSLYQNEPYASVMANESITLVSYIEYYEINLFYLDVKAASC